MIAPVFVWVSGFVAALTLTVCTGPTLRDETVWVFWAFAAMWLAWGAFSFGDHCGAERVRK